MRRRAFVPWRDRQDPAKLFFRDETAFNKLTDMRSSGWCSVGEVVSSVEPKRDVREKISAFAVVGYNEGEVNCYSGKKKLKRKLTHTFSYIVFNNSYTQTASNRVLNRARRSSLSPGQWSYETPNKPLSPTTVSWWDPESLNDQRLFSERHKKSQIQLKRSRSPSFHL